MTFVIVLSIAGILQAAEPAVDKQLAEKCERLQRLVEERVVQKHGLIPMFVRADDYQLPTENDYRGAYHHRHLRGKTEKELGMPPMHVWRAWENATSNTAFYLRAASYQYRATGDAKALAVCRRTWAALKRIASLAEDKGERGFVIKPYGGEYSTQSSTDQIQCLVWSLAAYRPIAPPQDAAEIDAWIKEIADYQMKSEYVSPYGYFGRNADELRKDLELKKKNWNLAILHLPLLHQAWLATGDSKYVKEMARLSEEAKKEGPIRLNTEKFTAGGFGGYRNLYLPALLMEYNAANHEIWRALMLGNYHRGRTGLAKDGTWPTSWKYDRSKKEMTPISAPETGGFGRTGRSSLFAMGCVTAHRWFPDQNMKAQARRILDSMNESTMRFVMPLDDKHPLPPEWVVESKMLDIDSLMGWLCAYWEGRYRGYW